MKDENNFHVFVEREKNESSVIAFDTRYEFFSVSTAMSLRMQCFEKKENA